MEQGGRLGVTAETLDNCVAPMAAYLQKEADLAMAQSPPADTLTSATTSRTVAETKEVQPIVAKFKIQDIDYQLSFYPTLVAPVDVAEQFCRGMVAMCYFQTIHN